VNLLGDRLRLPEPFHRVNIALPVLVVDRPPVLELYERHNPAGLDVNDRRRAAALLEQSLGDPDAAQDGALPHPWPFRQAELMKKVVSVWPPRAVAYRQAVPAVRIQSR
jgi:hypothetical protein